ncbi:MAG: hypothetical protein E7420_00495 [Ruminococcaceae bacterium]|nr:hypothetical protein [Oscillospiraceae bacterium]
MILRNGILSTLRGRGRTALFTVLIFLMSLSLTLGAGMWAYCSAQLEMLDNSYTSIALVEYMGADYPDENAADSFARSAAVHTDSDAISAIEGVELWEKTDSGLAFIEGFERQGESAYSNRAVIEFIQFTELWTGAIAYIAEEELPETFYAMDSLNWTARLHTPEFDSGFVNFYGSRSGYIWQRDTSTGETIYYEPHELTGEYIIGADNYVEYVNGDEKLRVPASRFETSHFYDSIKGLYGYETQVLQGWSAITNDILYARDVEGAKAIIIDANGHDFIPERGRRYTLHGQFVTSNTAHLRFAITDFYEGCETEPWQDTRDSEAAPIFYEYADYYSRANNYVTVSSSADIPSLEVFQQDIFRLEEGRFPGAGEKGVCLVSGDIARGMELSVGDSVNIKYFSSAADDRFDVQESGREAELEVVGIATMPENYYGYVWVSDAEGSFGGEHYGYQIGRALLDNAFAPQAAEAIEALCPEGVRVTLFDQGYSSAAQPLETMRSTALAVTLASACGAIAVIFLFAYLFVGRQKETVNVLFSLGTPKGKISLWLLSGAVMISAVASAVGAWLGALTLGKIISLAFSAAKELYAVDSRYSESAVGVIRESLPLGETPLWPALAAFAFIFVLSLLLCRVFLGIAQKQTAPKKGKLSVRVPKGGTSVAGKGAFRFAFLSARRGGWRSGVVPAAALVLSIFLGILATASSLRSEQMDALYRDTEISGRAVSTNGRRSTELVIAPENARTLWKSGMLKDIRVSISFNYWFGKDMPDFGTGSFAEDARDGWISRQPELVALNGLEAAEEFIYGSVPDVSWLSGWDEGFLSDPEACASVLETMSFYRYPTLLAAEKEADAVPCLMPQSLMERFGLDLGDSIQVNFRYLVNGEKFENFRNLYIVGAFPQSGSDANIYAPLTLWCDEDWINSEEDLLSEGERVELRFNTPEDRDKYFYYNSRFSTCVFTMKRAAELNSFRDYLSSKDFSRVDGLRSNRTTVLLFDRSFVETVGGLGRYISFSQLLFPVLFALMAILGFIISWLMVNARRMEFAISRGLGAGKVRVFFSFFLEQALLCLCGSILGCLLLRLAGEASAWWWAVALFALCYLLGAAVSVIAVGKTHLMSLLSERE